MESQREFHSVGGDDSATTDSAPEKNESGLENGTSKESHVSTVPTSKHSDPTDLIEHVLPLEASTGIEDIDTQNINLMDPVVSDSFRFVRPTFRFIFS